MARKRKPAPHSKAKAKCRICGKDAVGRDLCRNHYQLLWNAVKRGDTTFEEAERKGACGKKGEKKTGRPAFSESFPMLAKK